MARIYMYACVHVDCIKHQTKLLKFIFIDVTSKNALLLCQGLSYICNGIFILTACRPVRKLCTIKVSDELPPIITVTAPLSVSVWTMKLFIGEIYTRWTVLDSYDGNGT